MTSEGALSALTGKTGGSNDQMMKLIKAALPILLKFLTNNASSANGVASLLGALSGHSSQRTMAEQIAEADDEDGGKIVNHILGENKERVIQSLVQETELDSQQVDKGLASLAPALMSGLSAATGSAASDNAAGGLLGSLLGGGSGLGGLLGGLFGGAAEEKPAEADTAVNGADLLSLLTQAMKG